jgi:hypothetical protein
MNPPLNSLPVSAILAVKFIDEDGLVTNTVEIKHQGRSYTYDADEVMKLYKDITAALSKLEDIAPNNSSPKPSRRNSPMQGGGKKHRSRRTLKHTRK